MNIKNITSTGNGIDVDFDLTQEDMHMLGMEGVRDPAAAAARLEDLMQKGSVLLQAVSAALPGFSLPELSAALDAMTIEQMASTVTSGPTSAPSAFKPDDLTVVLSADAMDDDDGPRDYGIPTHYFM